MEKRRGGERERKKREAVVVDLNMGRCGVR